MAKWRTPKQEDLIGKDFIECQVRDDKNEKWKNAQLIRVSSLQKAIFPFTVKSTTLKGFVTSKASLNFRFCRIKDTQQVPKESDDTSPKVVEYSPGDIVYITVGEHRETAKVLEYRYENGEYIYRVQSLEDACRYSMLWYELELCDKATETPNSSTPDPGEGYRTPHPGDVGKQVEVRDSEDAMSDDARWVKRTLVAVIAAPINHTDRHNIGTFVAAIQGADAKHICHLWRFSRIKKGPTEPANTSEIPNSSTAKPGYFDDVDGVWVDEPNPFEGRTVVNEKGGKQSFVSVRFDCIPPVVLRLLAQCLGFGARKYGKDNWKNIEQWDHLNHAMNHINEWNRGDRSEPHLINAMARLTFALWQAVENKEQPDTYIHPDEVK